MTALPAATDFTGSTVTEGQFKTALTNLRAFLAEVLGAVGGGQADPASGSVFRRNALINGAQEVWNDATSSTSCPAGSRTAAAECWYVDPSGAAVTRARSTTVRTGALARYSLEIVGAASVTTVRIGQRIEAADITKIARQISFSAWIYNGSGASFQPSLLLGTPAAGDDFTTVTNRLTQTLQSCADATWTQVSHTVDVSAYTNLANGLQVEIQIPSGSLVSGDTVRLMEPQLAAGAVATLFEVEPVPLTELRTMRFFQKSFLRDVAPAQNVGVGSGYRWPAITAGATVQRSPTMMFPVAMRATPTVTLYNPAAANANVRDTVAAADCSSPGTTPTIRGITFNATGNASTAANNNLEVHWTANARLF